ncbi:endonuclease III [Helicobacter sp. MIT 14-3879]|uniref:endonuclease III n=1 Tax=Helicobacter sp. MIT 14-3879 TaxID=2040649 RepID=UPI000E1E395B|nr:endonuclease III [Helicobacter sp. MIT 14-3879]RDU64102.1 endonuclease III [Helicobacter sp. MIT 14-3879]
MKSLQKCRYKQIEKIFVERYKDAKTELNYKNLYELLICVILSAQCTDKRVNLITPALFKSYPNVYSLSKASLKDVKELIKSCSFFNNKAKNIIAMAKQVVDKFNGEIPLNQEELKSLSGVGQKTANVVLLEYCGKNLMAVDTHVFRVSHRLGLSKASNPESTEKDLNRIFKQNRAILHQGFVLFGRYICKAIKPECKECFVYDFCKYDNKMELK